MTTSTKIHEIARNIVNNHVGTCLNTILEATRQYPDWFIQTFGTVENQLVCTAQHSFMVNTDYITMERLDEIRDKYDNALDALQNLDKWQDLSEEQEDTVNSKIAEIERFIEAIDDTTEIDIGRVFAIEDEMMWERLRGHGEMVGYVFDQMAWFTTDCGPLWENEAILEMAKERYEVLYN